MQSVPSTLTVSPETRQSSDSPSWDQPSLEVAQRAVFLYKPVCSVACVVRVPHALAVHRARGQRRAFISCQRPERCVDADDRAVGSSGDRHGHGGHLEYGQKMPFAGGQCLLCLASRLKVGKG
jgi:hypothetical protein